MELNGYKASLGKYYRSLDGHNGAVLCMTFVSDGKGRNTLITGSSDMTLTAWDLDAGRRILSFIGHTGKVNCVAAACYSGEFSIASGSDDQCIIIWSMQTGEALLRIEAHVSAVTTMCICGDAVKPILISGGADSTIRSWNMKTGQSAGLLNGHAGPVSCLVASLMSHSVFISGGDDGFLKMWDAQDGSLLTSSCSHISSITAMAISPEHASSILVSGDSSGCIMVWELMNLSLVYVLHDGEGIAVSALAISGGFQPAILSCSNNNHFCLWDSKTGSLLRIYEAHTRPVMCLSVCYSAIGTLIASGSSDNTCVLWSPENDLTHSGSVENSIDAMELEESLCLVGKYLAYWMLSVKSSDLSMLSRKSKISAEEGRTIFYSMIRVSYVNSNMILMNVDALNYIMQVALHCIDLLRFDPLLGVSAMQFLLHNRLCLQTTQEWMRIDTNIKRVIQSLADPNHSNETLESILTALLSNEKLGGWSIILSNYECENIIRNLFLNSPRCHKQLAEMLRNHGMGVEADPYPVQVNVPRNESRIVVRWSNVKQGSGIYCYRIRVNNLLPTEYLMSGEFLGIIASSDEIESLVSVPLIEYILQYHWETWAYRATVFLGGIYSLYICATMIAVVSVCTKHFDDVHDRPDYIASVTLSIICNTLLMALAMWQFRSTKKKMVYINNLWNMSDLLMLALCHVSIISGISYGPIYFVKVISTLLTLVIWGRTLYFGRGVKTLSALLHTIKMIIWDVRYFGLILLLFMLAFAASFHVLGVFKTFFFSFIMCFNMMLGDVSFYYVRGHVFAQVLYVGFLVCVAIILLNSLIAFMDGSLEKATEKKDIAALVSRLQLVAELDVKMLPFSSLFPSLVRPVTTSKRDFMVLAPENEGKPNLMTPVSDKDILKQINVTSRSVAVELHEIKTEMYNQQNMLLNRVQHVELQMCRIEEKFDKLFTHLNSCDIRASHRDSVIGSRDSIYSYFDESADVASR